MVPKQPTEIRLELKQYLKIKQLRYIMDFSNVSKDDFHLVDLQQLTDKKINFFVGKNYFNTSIC